MVSIGKKYKLEMTICYNRYSELINKTWVLFRSLADNGYLICDMSSDGEVMLCKDGNNNDVMWVKIEVFTSVSCRKIEVHCTKLEAIKIFEEVVKKLEETSKV